MVLKAVHFAFVGHHYAQDDTCSCSGFRVQVEAWCWWAKKFGHKAVCFTTQIYHNLI